MTAMETNEIVFHVVDRLPSTPLPNNAYLLYDNWNDWRVYQTQYYLVYFDKNLEKHEIGSVKIAEKGLEPSRVIEQGKRRATLPAKFKKLPKNYFSLAPDIEYYENIENLQSKRNILKSLRDCAYDKEIYELYKKENVMKESLMRDIGSRKFNKYIDMATGQAVQTPYNFTYYFPHTKLQMKIYVDPNSIPPTNIYTIIGSNGVGKTSLLTNIYKAAANNSPKENSNRYGRIDFKDDDEHVRFSKVVIISFNSFDNLSPLSKDDLEVPVGIYGWNIYEEHKFKKNNIIETEEDTSNYTDNDIWPRRIFKQIRGCLYGAKKERMINALTELESDQLFKSFDIKSLLKLHENKLYSRIKSIYYSLSSGHRVIFLTIVHLINNIEEETLVLIDEPESHLHPPLLSSFIRTLSNILKNRNAISIIATHSPIVLQEVPRICVYQLIRSGNELKIVRPRIETFGENVQSLTQEVFGLEIMSTGFYQFITEIAQNSTYMSYEYIINKVFKNQIGTEGKAILLTQIYYNRGNHEED